MLYEDIPIAESLNYLLADAFDASGQEDVLEWLGNGKTIANMLGDRVSDAFYTESRRSEIRSFVHAFDLQELECYLNDSDAVSAILLRTNQAGLLVFVAGNPAGQPAFTTDWFKQRRADFLSSVSQ